ncbi:protease stability complex PrcB-like protein [Melghirimyces profundicolus]|uniref:Protease stability complex PrcB-like protein n=1 Tax=Melghirimyces profundicolus TaxID=1242148 RepID=A0A2T6BQD3_9BACL|nr:protease complex subunit PrcB family protein [Melghirimyces profundicolus]PTX58301.1 protease stability complex PrcB-like protein [Melghirimyces profundicolus]
MRKWKVALFMLLMVSLIGSGGCGSPDASDDSKGGASNFEKQTLSFQQESPKQLPEKVKKEQAEVMKESADSGKSSLTEVRAGDRTYLILSLGQRPTGGYSIRVNEVVKKGDTIRVVAEEVPPAKGSFTTQALTKPTVVISVKSPDEKVRFRYQIKEPDTEQQLPPADDPDVKS